MKYNELKYFPKHYQNIFYYRHHLMQAWALSGLPAVQTSTGSHCQFTSIVAIIVCRPFFIGPPSRALMVRNLCLAYILMASGFIHKKSSSYCETQEPWHPVRIKGIWAFSFYLERTLVGCWTFQKINNWFNIGKWQGGGFDFLLLTSLLRGDCVCIY